MKKDVNNWFAKFGTQILVKHKWLILASLALFTAFSVAGLKRIVMDNSYESMLGKKEEVSKTNELFENTFGNEDYVFLMVEAEEMFKHNSLAYLRKLSEDILERVPFVEDIITLTDMEYIYAENDELIVEDFIGAEIPTEEQELLSLRKKILSKELYLDRIISQDSKQAGILVRFAPIPDVVYIPNGHLSEFQNGHANLELLSLSDSDVNKYLEIKDPRSLIAPAIEKLIDEHASKGYKTTPVGMPISNYHINKTIQSETARTFLITLIVAIAILTLLYRSFPAILSPLLVIILANVFTFGMIGWLGIVLSTFAVILTLLLLVISIGYSIHIINHFRRAFGDTGDRKASLYYAYHHSGWPCFITAATTMVGFASFIFVPMIPVRNLGICCTIGVFFTYCLVMFFIPALYSFGKPIASKIQNKRTLHTQELANRFMRGWADISIDRFRLTSILSVGLVAAAIYFSFSIKVDTDFINLFGDKNKFVRDAKHATANLGSLYSYEVMIQLPEAGMAKNPEILKALDELDAHINGYETTKHTTSLNNLLKDINKTMHDNDAYFHRIPDTRDLAAQYLLLYEISGGEELENWVDYDYSNLRMSVQVKRSTTDLRHSFEDIKAFAFERFPEGCQIDIAGDMSIFIRAASALVNSQIISILIAFVSISLMMILVLRSLKLGLISMIPNVIPVLIAMGVMGFMGITLNLQTVVVGPVLIGIAVDDTVHYLVHFAQEFKHRPNYRQANRESFAKVGWALVFTSAILILGFSAFMFSIVDSIKELSLLLIIGILSALLADLLITPSIIKLIQPFGQELRPKQPKAEEEFKEIGEEVLV